VTEEQQKNIYTWKGPFRRYEITVHYDKTPVNAVSEIEGL
jgi:hypothetical protein